MKKLTLSLTRNRVAEIRKLDLTSGNIVNLTPQNCDKVEEGFTEEHWGVGRLSGGPKGCPGSDTSQGGDFMVFRTFNMRRWLPKLVACIAIGVAATQLAIAAKPGVLHRQPEGGKVPADAAKASEAPSATEVATTGRPAYQVADRSEAAMAASVAPQLGPGESGEHPLMPVLRWAYSGIGNIAKIDDYAAVVAQRQGRRI
jgi:hypothetical protein